MKSYRLAAVLCCLGAASPAIAETIYDNGPFVTHANAHASGADVSLAQDVTYPGYTALGISAGPDYRVADDFIVPEGEIWFVDAADIYAFQIGSEAPFTDARVTIWSGPPEGFGSVKLFDGTVANGLVSSTPGAYRIAQSTQAGPVFTDTQRRVQTLAVAVTGAESPTLRLNGTSPFGVGGTSFWIEWRLTGATAGQMVYTPPVSILGKAYTAANGFARFKRPNGGWELFENGTAPYLVDLPFKLHGSVIIDRIFRGSFEAIATTPPNPVPTPPRRRLGAPQESADPVVR